MTNLVSFNRLSRMNRFITYLLCLVVAASAVAQIDVNGLVIDKENKRAAGRSFSHCQGCRR